MVKYICGLGLLSLSLCACGPNARMNSGSQSTLASEDAGPMRDESHPKGPAEKESGAPAALPVVKGPSGEMVTAPVPVSGTFLVAKVLDKDILFTDSMTIGLAVYKDGVRVGSDTNRFVLDICLDELASPNVRVRKDLVSSTRGYDKEIRVYGNTLKDIEAAFPFIQIKYSVDDKSFNAVSSKTQNLSELLNP